MHRFSLSHQYDDQVFRTIERLLGEEEVINLENYMKEKERLLAARKEITDKIRLGKNQLSRIE